MPLGTVFWYYMSIMLRTRDLILFILVLFFLGMAIAATVVRDTAAPVIHTVVFDDTDVSLGLEATDSKIGIDRQSVIDRLRAKLENSNERIEPSASVEAPLEEDIVIENGGGIQRCLYPDDALSMVPRWPLADVVIKVQEGARVVFATETVVVPSVLSGISTTTVSEEVVTTVTPLLQLPVAPLKLTESVCVPSEVVGVTNGGILMFNGDVNSYRKIPENALIGYARDGFPIYGVYGGVVDQCGGYDHPQGYRYTISTERDYIVGCYVGTPSSFSL